METINFNRSERDFESRIRESFGKQQFMATIGAELTIVSAGEVHIEMPFDMALTQQNGYIHAGVITSIVDTACGFAAYSLMPAGSGVLSVEFKVNLLNPAKGDRFVAIGKVIKAGRTLTVCSGEVLAIAAGGEKVIAIMQATMMAILP